MNQPRHLRQNLISALTALVLALPLISQAAWAQQWEWSPFPPDAPTDPWQPPAPVYPPMEKSFPEPMVWENSRPVFSWDTYPTSTQMSVFMKTLAEKFPHSIRLTTLGYTQGARLIQGIHIGAETNERPVILVAGLHGDETAGVVILLRLAAELAAQTSPNADDAATTAFLQHRGVWIIPTLNPDGLYAAGNHTVYGSTRTTKGGADLNRSFPTAGPSVPEARAMANFLQNKSCSHALDIHSGHEVMTYPWDGTSEAHPEADWMHGVARRYIDKVHNTPEGKNSHRSFADGISNGHDWFPVQGSLADYATAVTDCPTFVLEMTIPRISTGVDLNKLWSAHKDALLHFLKETRENR